MAQTQEIHWVHHLDALIFIQPQRVLVARYQEGRASLNGALQDAIIVRIDSHVQGHLRDDEIPKALDLQRRELHAVAVPMEIIPQYGDQLIEYGAGYVNPNHTGARHAPSNRDPMPPNSSAET